MALRELKKHLENLPKDELHRVLQRTTEIKKNRTIWRYEN